MLGWRVLRRDGGWCARWLLGRSRFEVVGRGRGAELDRTRPGPLAAPDAQGARKREGGPGRRSTMSSHFVKRTQDSLGKVIKKPPLTEKLLSKPPFRYLHDIFTEVSGRRVRAEAGRQCPRSPPPEPSLVARDKATLWDLVPQGSCSARRCKHARAVSIWHRVMRKGREDGRCGCCRESNKATFDTREQEKACRAASPYSKITNLPSTTRNHDLFEF